jgi:hypothetical protein
MDDFGERSEILSLITILIAFKKKESIENLNGTRVGTLVFDWTKRDSIHQCREVPFFP